MLKTGCILRFYVVFRDGTVSLISNRCLNKRCSLHKSPIYFVLQFPKEKYDVVSSTLNYVKSKTKQKCVEISLFIYLFQLL